MAVDKKNIRDFIYLKVLDFALNDENLSGEESLGEEEVCEICQINLEELEAWLTSKKQIPQEKIVKLLLHFDLFKLQYDSLFDLQKPIISLTSEAIKKAAEYDEYLNEINNFWEYALSFESKEEEKNRKFIIKDFEKCAITQASQGVQSFIYIVPLFEDIFVLNENRSKYSATEWDDLLKKNSCIYEDICHSFKKHLEDNYFEFSSYYLDSFYIGDEDDDYVDENENENDDDNSELNEGYVIPFNKAINSNVSCFSYLSDSQKKNLIGIKLSLTEIYEVEYDENTLSFVNYRSLGWLAGDEGQKVVKNIFQQLVNASKSNINKYKFNVFDFNFLFTLFDQYIKLIDAPKKYHNALFNYRDTVISSKEFKLTDAFSRIKTYLVENESKSLGYSFSPLKKKSLDDIEKLHIEALKQIATLFPYLSLIDKLTKYDDINYWVNFFKNSGQEIGDNKIIPKPNNHFIFILKEKLHIETPFKKINTDIEDTTLVDVYLSKNEAEYFLNVLGFSIKTLCDKPNKGFHEIGIEIT